MSYLKTRLACIALLAASSASAALEIRSFTIDGGGGSSSSPRFVLSGTIGQPDAHASIGPRYSLDGGFWPAPAIALPGDQIFADDFE